MRVVLQNKNTKKPHRRKGEDPKVMPLPKPMKFGDIITADHLSFGKRDPVAKRLTGSHMEYWTGIPAGSIAFQSKIRMQSPLKLPCKNSSGLMIKWKISGQTMRLNWHKRPESSATGITDRPIIDRSRTE
jgi:hypothetical protein